MSPTEESRTKRALKALSFGFLDRVVPPVPLRFLPPRQTTRLAYQLILDREPDLPAEREFVSGLRGGSISRQGIAERLIYSEELRAQRPIRDILLSMHVSRCEFVRGMPRASRILDLGGTHQGYADGALVHMGYPYPFGQLTVVDLPVGERHEIYQGGGNLLMAQSPLGPVAFEFHSMTNLKRYADGAFDLVYSGQSIEHVTEAEGKQVMAEVLRVLEPGGYFCLDTPNGPAWRTKSAALMNPDHKFEYSSSQLLSALSEAGFVIEEVKGLNYMGEALKRSVFDEEEASRNSGVYAAVDDCLLLAVIARKPGPALP